MSKSKIYAIGDIHGCCRSSRDLIEQGPIDLGSDQLWFVGDLVNRGPHSLKTLRYIKGLSDSMGDRLKVVLGNHDLHLLAMAYGVKNPGMNAGLKEILDASDRIELIEWLRHRPLFYRDKQHKLALVHAGVYPEWSIKEAAMYAQEVEAVLHSENCNKLLKKMYGKRPAKWSKNLESWARYRFIINAMTRMRYCTRKGGLNFSHAGQPGTQSRVQYPWYQLPITPRKNWRIIFGHWASAGAWFNGNHIALDSGCVWGDKMTMARVDRRFISFTQITCKKKK